MNSTIPEQNKLNEEDELMSKFNELKAALLEETKGGGSMFSRDSDLIQESYSCSYLSLYGGN